MKKQKTCIALALLAVLLLAACASKDERRFVSKVVGVDVSAGTVVQSKDTHGGFHNDGATYIEIAFADKALEETIKNAAGWEKLPLTDNLQTILYGHKNADSNAQTFITDEDGNKVFPAVQNGYYFFYDRSDESKDPKDDTDLLSRYSFNFTLVLYDADRQALYYYAMDT